PRLAVIFDAGELPARVDVSLDDVAAESGCGRDGAFEIHWRAGVQPAKCRPRQRLARYVSRKRIGLDIKRCQTHTVDGDRIAVICAFGDDACRNNDARVLTALLDTAHAPELFNDSGEHERPFLQKLR